MHSLLLLETGMAQISFSLMLEAIFCAKLTLTPYRLMATDVHIARAAHAQGQPYYIVRNKMDVVSG